MITSILLKLFKFQEIIFLNIFATCRYINEQYFNLQNEITISNFEKFIKNEQKGDDDDFYNIQRSIFENTGDISGIYEFYEERSVNYIKVSK